MRRIARLAEEPLAVLTSQEGICSVSYPDRDVAVTPVFLQLIDYRVDRLL